MMVNVGVFVCALVSLELFACVDSLSQSCLNIECCLLVTGGHQPPECWGGILGVFGCVFVCVCEVVGVYVCVCAYVYTICMHACKYVR